MRSLRNTRFMLWLNTGSGEARFFKIFFFQVIATMVFMTLIHYVLLPFRWKLFSELPLTSGDDWLTCLCGAIGVALVEPLSSPRKPKQTVE